MWARAVSTSTTRMRWASNPSGSAARLLKVETNDPAATRSTSDNATWRTTRLPERAPDAAPWPRSRSASIGAAREARNAGPAPNRTAVRTAMAAVTASTRQSSDKSSVTRVSGVERLRTTSRLAHSAKTRPAAAPSPDSRRLSASSCRASCQRELPSASLTLISWRRAAARTISRFAMFTHATSRTSTTTARIVSSGLV